MILTIIPARAGSKGVKNKNIKKIGNKTLIDYRIDMIKKANLKDNLIILSTDSKIYKKLFEKKIYVPFLRPKKLSLDKSESFPLIKHAINFFKKKGRYFKYLILLEPPTPFVKAKNLKKAFKVIKQKKADLVSSISETDINSNFISTISKNNNLNLMMEKIDKIKKYQRQSFAKEFRMDGGFYIFKVSFLQKSKRLFTKGMNSYGFKINRYEGFNIETENDLKFANCIHKFIKNYEN